MSLDNQFDQLLGSSYEELEKLKHEVTQLEQIRLRIEDLITSNEEMPSLFKTLLGDLDRNAKSYTTGIDDITKRYVKEANDVFKANNADFASKLKELNGEIARLVSTDFVKLFEQLQKAFMAQTSAEIARELGKIDDKANAFQLKIDDLKGQVDRLQAIDLEEHFSKHQKVLSEMFGAINTINISLTRIISTNADLAQSLSGLRREINDNANAQKEQSKEHYTKLERHLIEQDELSSKHLQTLEAEMKNLAEKQEGLSKEVKVNRIILIAGLMLIVILLGYHLVKK